MTQAIHILVEVLPELVQLVVYYQEKTPYAPVSQIAFFSIICFSDYSDISSNVSDILVIMHNHTRGFIAFTHITGTYTNIYMQVILFVFCLVLFGMRFNVPVICHGQVDTVSSPNHTFFQGKLD